MNFQFTWKKNPIGGNAHAYCSSLKFDLRSLQWASRSKTACRRGCTGLSPSRPFIQTARSVTSAPLMHTTPRTSIGCKFLPPAIRSLLWMSCHHIEPGCLNHSPTGANSHWGQVSVGEMIYKNEGAQEPPLLPQETEGLNSEEVLTIGGEKRTLLHSCLQFYLWQLSPEVAGAFFLTVHIYELTEWRHLSRPELWPLSASLLSFQVGCQLADNLIRRQEFMTVCTSKA